MDQHNRSARQQNKNVIVLGTDRMSCVQFYRKIENDHLESIMTVQEAFESKRQCIIMGKVVKLQPRISNDIRRDITEKSDPATFIIIKEVIGSCETVAYGRLYKVKFSGAIAKELLEADITVGDRIAIRNLAAVEENTEYNPSTRFSSLTPLVLDRSETTVIIGKKVFGDRICKTPDSEAQTLITSQRNDRTENQEHDSPIAMSSGLCSNNKQKCNDGAHNSSPFASSHNFHNKTSMKNKKNRVYSPPKTPLHVALEEDANSGDDDSSSFAIHCEKVKYINLKDINRTHVNCRIDIFGIVLDVLQSKIESKNEELNGRIFTAGCLVCFPTEKGMPKFITSRKKPYDFSEQDKHILKRLKAFLAVQKSWNILALPNSYYPDAPNGIYSPHVKLEDITENTIFFSLKCKISSVRFFLEVNMAFLTVEDNTVCHPPTYQFPKELKSWSGIVQAEELYCSDSSKIDILLKNMADACTSDAASLLMQAGSFIDIVEIQARKIFMNNKHGLMFIADMKTTRISQVDQIESASPTENEEESNPPEHSNTMEISEYNELLAECRVEGMSPTTEKILRPIPEEKGNRKKRRNENSKRRKLIPTTVSGTNIFTDDFLNNSPEDVNVSVPKNDQNTPMEHDACNEQLSNIEDRLLAVEGSEVSKISDLSSLQSTQKGNCQSPNNLHQRVTSLIENKKTLVLKLIKLTDSEISCSTSNAGISCDAESKTGNVDNLSDASSTTSKQEEACCREGNLQLTLNNETLISNKSSSSHNERFTGDVEMDHTNHDNVPVEECSLIESCVLPDNVPHKEDNSSNIKKTKLSKDKVKCFLSKTKSESRSFVRNLFSVKSCNVISSSSSKENVTDRNQTVDEEENQPLSTSSPANKKLSESNLQNCKNKKTRSDKTRTPSSLSVLETDRKLSKHNHNLLGAMLDDDEPITVNSGTEEDIFNHTPEKTFTTVKNVCSQHPKSSASTTKHQTCNEENQLSAGKSRVSSSPTQFSPAVSCNLPGANLDVDNAGAERNAPSPSPSIVTEKFYPPRERIICTRKSIHNKRKCEERPSSPPRERIICTRKSTPNKRKYEERLSSPPISPPQSIVTEKLYPPRERIICTRKKYVQEFCDVPHKTALLQQDSENKNPSCTIEKWLQQVDPNLDAGECTDDQSMLEPVAEPLLDESLNLPESHNLAEYMTTRDDVNNPRHVKLISDNAVLINSEPSILDEPLDIISGYCKESCDAFFRYSILKFNPYSKPICPGCEIEGKRIEVQLVFLFKLHLILQKSQNVCYAAVVHANHASQFLGCTEHQYINDEGLRSQIVKNLSEHFLLKGKVSPVVYSPSLPVNLKVISNNDIASGQNSSMAVHLVDTILPEPNATQPPIESFFSS